MWCTLRDNCGIGSENKFDVSVKEAWNPNLFVGKEL